MSDKKIITESKRCYGPDNMIDQAYKLYKGLEEGTHPFCIMCKKSIRDHKISHIIPRSILQLLGGISVRLSTGQVLPPKNIGYKGFCESCEQKLQYGENHFTQDILKPLIKTYD